MNEKPGPRFYRRGTCPIRRVKRLESRIKTFFGFLTGPGCFQILKKIRVHFLNTGICRVEKPLPTLPGEGIAQAWAF
jgi:hypothetical protein